MNDNSLIEETAAQVAVRIRVAAPDDDAAVDRLAELDERRPGAAPHLIADDGGEIVAALSLADGIAVSDPFRRTDGVLALLRQRAAQLGGRAHPSRTPTRRRATMHRAMLTLVAASVALASLAGAANGGTTTTTPTIAIPADAAKLDPLTKRFTITVRCLTTDADCEGVLDTRTATKVKPYSSQPAAVAKVGTFPFRIAAGGTAKVTGRVYGPALAQAMLAGKVRLNVVGRALGAADPLGTKIVTLTYKRV